MFCMYLLGVVVLELDSHSDHNKGPDLAPCADPKSPFHRSLILAILHTRQTTL